MQYLAFFLGWVGGMGACWLLWDAREKLKARREGAADREWLRDKMTQRTAPPRPGPIPPHWVQRTPENPGASTTFIKGELRASSHAWPYATANLDVATEDMQAVSPSNSAKHAE